MKTVIFSGSHFGGHYEQADVKTGDEITKEGFVHRVTDNPSSIQLDDGTTVEGVAAVFIGMVTNGG